MVNAGDTRFCLAAVPSNLRLVYVEQTFSRNCIFQGSSRQHQMHISQIKCRLVYTKRDLFLKSNVSSTPNTYFGQRIRNPARTRMLLSGEIIGNAPCQMVPRLHRTHIFKKQHSQASVSSTPNAHSENQVSSRAKCYLF